MKEYSSTAAHHPVTRSPQLQARICAAILLSVSFFLALAAPSIGTASPRALASFATTPQETFSGTWTAEARREEADKEIQLSFHRRNAGGNTNFSGHGFALSDFQGLTREQVYSAASTPVSFRLVREAGTIELTGSFHGGRGAGDWRLTPSEAFRSAMRSRGYDNLTSEQMFTSAMIDLTSQFVDDLKTIGFDRLPFQEVIKARIFNVTPQFVSEMKSLGFDNLDLEDLVKARIFKVDTEFVRQVQAMGFDTQSLEGLVKLRIFRITPEYISLMKSADFQNLSAEELVKLKIFEITPDFVKSMKAEGLSPLSVEDAVKLKIHHVDEDFIRRAKQSGYTDLNVEDLVHLKIRGKIKQ